MVKGNPHPVRTERVELLFLPPAAKGREGFDKRSPNGEFIQALRT